MLKHPRGSELSYELLEVRYAVVSVSVSDARTRVQNSLRRVLGFVWSETDKRPMAEMQLIRG